MPGKHLVIEADGSSRGNPGPGRIGVVVKDERGVPLATVSKDIGRATNNQAEYEALLAGLEVARAKRAESVEIRMDSELVVSQIKGTYRVKAPSLLPLYQRAKALLAQFQSYSIQAIPREQNRAADALARNPLKQ